MSDMTWADIQRQEDGRPPAPLTFVPGVDFDPDDEEEVEIVGLASGKSAADRLWQLERENARLRGLLEDLYDE
jgi:hypothetical protein